MGNKYKHISPEQRIQIYELLYKGETLTSIALVLGYNKSSIHRELKRNCSKIGYRPDWANNEYAYRRRYSKKSKIENDPELENEIISKLRDGWSPQLIDGRLRLENGGKCIVSHETIYRYIYSEKGRVLKLYKLLKKQRIFRYPRVKRRRYIKRDTKPSIKDRDQVINDRAEFGHWEGDLVIFSKLKNNLLTLRERDSRFIVAIKNQSRKAHTTMNALIKHMKNAPIKSLTLDNDPAFAKYRDIKVALNSEIYFCEPYKSYQKGAIENANRLLREEFPRKTNISKINQKQINIVVDKLNHRPMKCLGYKTPYEIYNERLMI
jgi:IS30 family transposase